MEIINELLAAGFVPERFFSTMLIFAAGSVLLGLTGRFIFGKDSIIDHAVSAAVGILFVYIATVVVLAFSEELAQFRQYLSPLPFVDIAGGELTLMNITEMQYTALSAPVLSMVILAFLVNLLDTVLPRGSNFVSWFLFRCATVALSILAHWFVSQAIATFLPDLIVEHASTVLLWLLLLMLGVGILRVPIGALIATVNPVVGALYTFFFANLIGKQLTKAVVTTGILVGLVWVINQIGVSVICVAAPALMAYIPLLAVMVAVWFFVNSVL